jgi:hypothetical protein
MDMFEWNEGKEQENFAKHGIWFDEAKTIWADPLATERSDPDHSDDEERWIRIGLSESNNTLLVVFCERVGDKIRIISARKLTPKERREYEG